MWSDQFSKITVEEPIADAVYYELIFETATGGEEINVLWPHEFVDQVAWPAWMLWPEFEGIENWGIGVTDMQCVRVAPVYIDGTVGEHTERCEPDKCVYYEQLGSWFGETDWDAVDGCPDPPPDDEGQDENGEPAENDGQDDDGDEDEPDDQSQTDDQSQPGDGEEEQEDEGSGCTAASGGPAAPAAVFVVFAAGLLLHIRRKPTTSRSSR